MANTVKDTIKTRKIAVLAADGVDDADLAAMKKALVNAGAQVKVIAPRLGVLKGAKGEEIKIDFSFLTSSSVLFDAVYIPGGEKSVEALKREADAIHFVNEAYKHCKAIAATGAGVDLLKATYIKTRESDSNKGNASEDGGVIIGRDAQVGKVVSEFIKAIAQHRNWSRETGDQVPA